MRRRIITSLLVIAVPLTVAGVAQSAPSSGPATGITATRHTTRTTTIKGIRATATTGYRPRATTNQGSAASEGCALPAGMGALPKDANHGMYVSAWATTHDGALISAAARSDCGKPHGSERSGSDHAHAGGAGHGASAHGPNAHQHGRSGR